jgi:hypothetical protein
MTIKSELTKVRLGLDKLATDKQTGLDSRNWTYMNKINPQFREFTLKAPLNSSLTPNRIGILTKRNIHELINKPH